MQHYIWLAFNFVPGHLTSISRVHNVRQKGVYDCRGKGNVPQDVDQLEEHGHEGKKACGGHRQWGCQCS